MIVELVNDVTRSDSGKYKFAILDPAMNSRRALNNSH